MSQRNFLGEFEHMVLLGVLQQGARAFALEVRREIEERAGRSVSRGAFYTTLERLERKGFLRWSEEASGDVRGGALRRFQVTPEGLEAVRVSREALLNLARGLEGMLEEA